jgi:hypothetical protein
MYMYLLSLTRGVGSKLKVKNTFHLIKIRSPKSYFIEGVYHFIKTFCQFLKFYFWEGGIYCFTKTLPIAEIVFQEGVRGLNLWFYMNLCTFAKKKNGGTKPIIIIFWPKKGGATPPHPGSDAYAIQHWGLWSYLKPHRDLDCEDKTLVIRTPI